MRLAAGSRRHSSAAASKPSGTFAVMVLRHAATLASSSAPDFGEPMHFRNAEVAGLAFATAIASVCAAEGVPTPTEAATNNAKPAILENAGSIRRPLTDRRPVRLPRPYDAAHG